MIGLSAGADGNLALLSGAGSRWVSGGDFLVGSNGSLNQLIVSNGAKLFNANGDVGQAPRIFQQFGMDYRGRLTVDQSRRSDGGLLWRGQHRDCFQRRHGRQFVRHAGR